MRELTGDNIFLAVYAAVDKFQARRWRADAASLYSILKTIKTGPIFCAFWWVQRGQMPKYRYRLPYFDRNGMRIRV